MGQGGRYTVDPETGERVLVERTGLEGQQQQDDQAPTDAPETVTEEPDDGA